MSDALWAMGATLSRDGHVIAEITKIGGIETILETLDVTSLNSPNDYREFKGTLFNPGDLGIEGNFIAGDSDGQIGLIADQSNKTVQSFVITFPDVITATWSFTAIVEKFKIGDFTVDGKIGFSASLKLTGMPVLAIGASTAPSALVVTGNVSGALALTPAFSGTKYEYVADGSGDASVTVTVTAPGASSIEVNGTAVTSGSPSGAITLTEDDLTTLTIEVTDTGKVTKTYVIKVIGPVGS